MANNFLASPLEDALSKAPSFGLPDTFRQSAEGRQSVTITPGNVPFQAYFSAASRKYGVPINVLMGLAQQESGFNPTALGQPTQYGRAKGIMQYIDSTAQGLGINPYDPMQAIDGAARQLRERLDKGYSMQDAVQAHFGGDDRKQWGPKTRAYGVDVLGKAQRFFDGTAGDIKQATQARQAADEQDAQFGADYPAAQSAMENMDQNRLRDNAARLSQTLDELNKDEPGRYRPATAEEIAQAQAKLSPQGGQQQQKPVDGQQLDFSEQNARTADTQKNVLEQNASYLQRFGHALGTGYDDMNRSLNNSVWLVKGGDTTDIAKGIADSMAQRQAEQENRTPGQKTLDAAIKKVSDAKGFWETTTAGWDAVKTAATEPGAVGLGAAESAASMLPTMVGTAAGAVTGGALGAGVGSVVPGAGTAAAGATGAVWGGRTGMVAGTTAVEAGAELEQMVQERLAKEGKPATAANIKTVLDDPDFRSDAQTRATAKGLTVGVVDLLTMGLAGKVLSAPAKSAERKAITSIMDDVGVDEKAARALLSTPAGRVALEQASPGALKKAMTHVGAFSIELAGEPVSEAASQAVARQGNVDWGDVAAEGIYGAGQAAGHTVAAKIFEAGKGAATRLRKDNQPPADGNVDPAAGVTDPAAGNADPAAGAVDPAAAGTGASTTVDPAQAQQDDVTAAAPTPGRDDSGLSADAGPIERALRGTADQPDDANGQFWAGEPGSAINVQAKGDPDTAMNVTVEKYLPSGNVTVRDEHGAPYELSPDVVDINAAAAPATEQQQMQTAGTPEENRDSRQEDQQKAQGKQLDEIAKAAQTFPEGSDAVWKNADHDIPVTVKGVESSPGSDGRAYVRVESEGKESFVPLDELTPAKPKSTSQTRPADRPLTDFSEDELRDRMRYLARQAKTNGGWDKNLTKARREVEKVLDAKVRERENGPANIHGLTELEDMRLQQLVNMDGRTKEESEEATRLLNKRGAALTGQSASETTDENTVGKDGLTLVHGSGNPSLTAADVQIVRANGQKQGKKGRVYGGFYGTSEKDAAQAEGYAGMMEGTPTVYDVKIRPGTRIFRKEGDITRLSENTINDLVSKGYGVVVGTDPRGRTEYAVIDKNVIGDLSPRSGRAKNEEGSTSTSPDAGQLAGPEVATAEQPDNAGAVRSSTERPATAEQAGQRGGSDTLSGTGPGVDADSSAAVSDGQQSRPLTGTDGKPKWFASAEKAAGHIEKKGLTGYRVVQVKPKRFEIHADATLTNEGTTPAQNNDVVSGTAPASKTAQTTVNPRTNRVKKLVGEVGDMVSPSGDVGYASAGSRYRVSRIEKNGTVHLINQDTAASTALSLGELEGGRGRNVSWSRQSPQAQSDTKTQSDSAKPSQNSEWQAFPEDSGSLGVPRAEMPQVKAEHRGPMVNFLNARGVEHWEGEVPADTLKPTQAEFSPAKVARAAENTGSDRSILVSNDGYVVDGHHQWLAARDKGEDVKTIRLDAPVRELLPLLHEFPSSLVDTSSADVKQNPGNVKENPDSVQQTGPEVKETGQNVNTGAPETASNEGAKPEVAASKDADRFAENKLFTADKVAAARARMKSKFGQLNSGLDPELLIDGMTIAGAYIESGIRKFSDYAKAMVDDFGDGVKPYLLSFWEGARNYPGLDTDGMSSVADSAKEHAALLEPQHTATPAVGEIKEKPTSRTRKTGQRGDITLTQDWGVDHIDGYSENTSGRETGSDVKDAWLKEGKSYLNAVADQLENAGFKPTTNSKGKTTSAVSVNPAGDAVSGDISLTMDGPNGTGIYIHMSDTSLRGVVPTTTSGIGIMYRTTTPADRYGSGSQNRWAPVDLSATDLARMAVDTVNNEVNRASRTEARQTGGLDDMVAQFDNEVTENGNATELGGRSTGALGGVSADEVRGNEEGRDAGGRASGRSDADGRGNGGSGGQRVSGTRGVGDDPREVPVSARGAEPEGSAGRGAVQQRSRAERGDGDTAGRGERDRPAAGVTAQEKPASLFTIDPATIGQGGKKAKYRDNVAAIRLLKELETANQQATADEQAQLAKYVGWGGIPEAFERTDGTSNSGWAKETAELKDILTPEEYQAAVASTRNAHYTSPQIVSAMWQALDRLGFTGGRVVEPSVGVGNFFGLMPQGVRKASALHGVELDRITSGIATQLYPEAKIARMGYQDYTIPDGYFDVAIGNPPFGSEKLYDSNRKDLSGFSIHNYFFARSVDALRPGGVMAMVVTNRFMDGAKDQARQYIAERADLLGAIRLPNDAFAKNAGTEVTTDIIFLRKPLENETSSSANRSWLQTVDFTDKQGNVVPLNKYFEQHPENMLGEFGAFGTMYRKGDTALVARDGQNTPQLLAEAINRLPAGVMTPAVTVTPESRETVRAENVRVGSSFINSDGRVMVRGDDVMGEHSAAPVTFRTTKAEERVKGMIRVRDALQRVRELQLSERASDAAIEEARTRLNNTYDGFVKANGPINSQANKLLFRDDPTWPQISALEDSYDKGVSADIAKKTGQTRRNPSAVKAAIFSRRTQQPHRPPESASSAKDALVASLAERGRVDMDYMRSLYGKDAGQIADELGDLLFNDPQSGWQTRDAYLSGNVKQKLAQAEAAAKADPSLSRNVDALKAVQPKDIEAVDIAVKPGASWIPAEVMGQFADHLTEGTGSRAFFNPLTASWIFPQLEATTSATARYGTGRMSLGDILTATAAQKTVQVYDTHRDGSRTLNETETQLANEKVALVRDAWNRWIWQDDARRTQLARLYNDQFNTDVAREFDGSHLTFPGKVSDDIIRLRPHQANAVWRIVQGDSTLLDHVVGAGKTFTIVAGIMELRRMGLARKPILTVPNHLVGQWAKDFIKLYPGANVLAATKKDFEAANRKRFFARVATGDWDVVIVAHSSFGKVGVHPDTESAFIKEEIADITASIAAIEAAEGKKSRNVKGGEERRKKMEERLKRLLDTDNKDNSLYWDDMGIDALAVDEAHEFKNLAYTSGMRGVAGLGSAKGSQKAQDLYMKTRIVREATGGRNVVFATGTPISNTMAEMFTMQRYLDHDNLKASGLSHFDAWARMFGEVVTDWELSPSGQYKMNSRFAKFVNMPELMQRYTSFADVINRDDINAQLAAQGKRLPVPKVKGGKPANVVVPRSEDQANYIGEPVKDAEGNPTDEYPAGSLVYRAEHLPKKAEKGKDNMLSIMSDARKAALDMRLLFPELPDNPNSKVNVAAGRISAIYDQWNADRGTQLVFIDLSTPKASRGKEAERIRELVAAAESDDADVASAAQDQLDKMSPDELLALESKFSVYDDLKQKLIDRGIPENEIAFIHDANTDEQKTELFAKVNAGTIRVLLGSTPKMGAGMNAQERLVALHHLDAPWRPSDLEQREGRIIRQGNKLYDRDPDNFEVIINRYATKQTLDSRMWQTIEAKARFIEQVRKGNTAQREIEDIGGEAANAAEMKAASSGNPLMLEEMSLRQKVRTLENERMAHDRDQYRVRDKIRQEQSAVKTIQRTLGDLRADVQLEQPSPFAATIDGQTFDKRKEAGAAILTAASDMLQNGQTDRENIGSYGGFRLSLDELDFGHYALQLEGKGTYSVNFELAKADAQGLAVRMSNAVNDLPGAVKKMETALDRSEKAIPALEEQVRAWPKEDELKTAEQRHREVIDQLRPKREQKPAPTDEGAAPTGETLNSPIFRRGGEDGSVVGKIREVLAAARAAGHAAMKATLAPVPEWLSREARRAGLNVEGFVHVLDGSAVRHTLKNHSDAAKEGKRGQLAVTDADFERLPEVVSSPDRVVFGTQNRLHKDQIVFIKRLEDGTILYLEEVRTGRKELAAVSVRKYPATMNVDAIASTLDPNARSDGGSALNIVANPADDKTGTTLDAWQRISSSRRQATSGQQAEMRRMLSQAVPADKLGELVRRIEIQNQTATSNPQRVLASLRAAEISGEFNPEGMRLAQWLIRQYPHLADTLRIDVRKGEDNGVAGNYNVADRLVTLFSDYDGADGKRQRVTDTITATHEIMHHLERMMPRDVQQAIAQEWLDGVSARMEEYKDAGDTKRLDLLTDLISGIYGNPQALDRAKKALINGDLPASDYQFASPSEYWAENGASLIAGRKVEAEEQQARGWIDKAVAAMRAIIAKVRSLLGRKSDERSAVEDALDRILAGDGKFQSDATLQRVGDEVYGLSGDRVSDYVPPVMPQLRSGRKPEIPTPEEDNAMVRSRWDRFKDAAKHGPSDKTTDAMQKLLYNTPYRPLAEELGRNVPALQEYLKLKQQMDAMRAKWHHKTDTVAQRWLKYRAHDKVSEAENKRLMDIMHESTIQQVDPSERYESMLTPRDHDALKTAIAGTERGDELLTKAAEDSRRRQEWERMKPSFDQLSPEAKAIYRQVRDTYSSLADAYEGVLLSNMEKAINVRIKKAEREHRRELRRITDEGLSGQARTDAVDQANRRLKASKTKTAWNRKARITQLRQQFEMERLKGPYFPLARFGDLFVTVRDKAGKVISFSRFEKASEQREFADLMREDPNQSVQIGTINQSASLRKGVDAGFVADVEDILAELPNAEKIKDEVWQRYLETLPDFSIRKNRIHRTGRAGYTSDALRAFGNSMFHGSHQLARLAYTFDLEEALDAAREQAENTKDPVRDGMVVNEMEHRHQFVMNPTGGALATAVTQASFVYFLAANPKAAIANMFQTVVMGVPMLAANEGKWSSMTRAFNQLNRALSDTVRGKGTTGNSKRLTADERAALEEAHNIGLIDRTQSHDLAGVAETGVEYRAGREKWMKRLGYLFHHTERINREVTFLAAYRMAKARGLNQNAAIDEANRMTWKIHFDYQNTSRPRIMHSDAMKMLLVFKNYAFNMLYRLFRDFHQSFKGETPELRKEARIQLAGVTGMMMLTAGISGTWGFGILMMLAGLFMGGDKDPEDELRKNMQEALGPMMTGIIMDGVPGYTAGVSLSDSVGMADLWWRDPNEELEGGKEVVQYMLMQMLGAPAGIALNMGKGVQQITDGHEWRGIETMMPNFIKNPMKAMRYEHEGVRNMRGDMLVDDVSQLDAFKQLVGFIPAKIAEQYDINNANYRKQDFVIKERKTLMDDYWRATQAEDDAAVSKIEDKIDTFNEKWGDDMPGVIISPKTLNRSAKTREKNAEDATGGARYNRSTRDYILENQRKPIYQ